MRFHLLIIFIHLLFTTKGYTSAQTEENDCNDDEHEAYTNSFAVEIEGGEDIADAIAATHGFLNKGQVSTIQS